MIESDKKIRDVLDIRKLEAGKKFVQVTHGSPRVDPDGDTAYSTTLTNISTERIKVTRFGGYWESESGWVLSNVTGDYYSAAEFREWYGLGTNEWIESGASAADENNYGGLPAMWAYFFESESGKKFVAGAIVK